MKIATYLLLLKIAVLISALLTIGVIGVNIYIYFFELGTPAGAGPVAYAQIIVFEHIAMALLYLVIAFCSFKLLVGTADRELISRKNLTLVKGILWTLLALLLTKIAFAWVIGNSIVIPAASRLYFRVAGILGSTWELLMAFIVIFILAVVFEKAVRLKEEEALTI
ncbi:hypothetical protein HGH93_28290 [Chitinophaga polysaccharea]|uniref:DUF2975 domain-containing protein n=1 Tax=Chitinophaga polysaccharea TaxID=1293035 RepID=UPI00145557CE|nr:DUF2975 domain-containing protein [Chitinophaga polysaccharea]NLR62027.1 hypothetical protein [Chitinophaga polysaccharea]